MNHKRPQRSGRRKGLIKKERSIKKTDNESLYPILAKMQGQKEFYFAIWEKEWYDGTEKHRRPQRRPEKGVC
jgi:hypothetical protein